MARLATGVWIGAYLARLGAEGIPAHLLHKGDDRAGAVAVKVATLNGRASLFTRSYDSLGERVWTALLSDAAEAEIDAAIRRQRGYDPDLWVVEVEDPKGRHLLDQLGLKE
ncbi:MAG: DUF1491 family protein [Pseudomonadota bacterium]